VEPPNDAAVSKRTMEVVVALLFLLIAGIVIADSQRLGSGWGTDGPQSGYFPFYIALVMSGASLFNLYRALFRGEGADVPFVGASALRKVVTVLVPLLIYVASIGWVGIYAASAVYLALFMWHFGSYALWKSGLGGAAFALALFCLFERWFLVPLPKGPLEAWLGY